MPFVASPSVHQTCFSAHCCFHAQQCAEKALKALLIARSIEFPPTHAIERLLDLLSGAAVELPPDVDEAFILTQYAVQTRYPGVWEPVTELRLATPWT